MPSSRPMIRREGVSLWKTPARKKKEGLATHRARRGLRGGKKKKRNQALQILEPGGAHIEAFGAKMKTEGTELLC